MAVVGLGSNGVLLGILAREAGAEVLIGSDPDPGRRRHAGRLGFDRVIDPSEDLTRTAAEMTAGRGADAVFVLPTVEEAFEAAVAAAAPAGRVVFYSPIEPGKVWRLLPHGAYLRDLTLRFCYSCGPREIRTAIAAIERGVVKAESVVTHRVPLERAPEAFRLALSRGDVLKVVVTM